MSNFFEQLTRKVRGSTAVLMLQLFALAAIVVGSVHFVEDTRSSYDGLKAIERYFSVTPALFTITYLTASLAPQVGQVVFGYIYLNDRKRNLWAGVVVVIFFIMDMLADVQSRSSGQLFSANVLQNWDSVVVATYLTFVYFTVGSELFITAGLGIFLELFTDSVDQAVGIYLRLYEIYYTTKGKLEEAKGRSGGGRRQPSQRRGGAQELPGLDPRGRE